MKNISFLSFLEFQNFKNFKIFKIFKIFTFSQFYDFWKSAHLKIKICFQMISHFAPRSPIITPSTFLKSADPVQQRRFRFLSVANLSLPSPLAPKFLAEPMLTGGGGAMVVPHALLDTLNTLNIFNIFKSFIFSWINLIFCI